MTDDVRKVKVSTPGDFEEGYVQETEIRSLTGRTYVVKIRRGISPEVLLASIPIPNPLLPVVAEKPTEEADANALRTTPAKAIEMLRKVAAMALIYPEYPAIAKYIDDDTLFLGDLFEKVTGLGLFKGVQELVTDKEGGFRPGGKQNRKR